MLVSVVTLFHVIALCVRLLECKKVRTFKHFRSHDRTQQYSVAGSHKLSTPALLYNFMLKLYPNLNSLYFNHPLKDNNIKAFLILFLLEVIGD